MVDIRIILIKPGRISSNVLFFLVEDPVKAYASCETLHTQALKDIFRPTVSISRRGHAILEDDRIIQEICQADEAELQHLGSGRHCSCA